MKVDGIAIAALFGKLQGQNHAMLKILSSKGFLSARMILLGHYHRVFFEHKDINGDQEQILVGVRGYSTQGSIAAAPLTEIRHLCVLLQNRAPHKGFPFGRNSTSHCVSLREPGLALISGL